MSTQPTPARGTTPAATVVMIDNHDSFVYNLVEALRGIALDGTALDFHVVRNTITPAEVEALAPDVLVFSPGPGHPRQAGHMMDILSTFVGRVPILGICLGFQALIEHLGGSVAPCGPVHGSTDRMRLSDEGVEHPVFAGLAVDAGPERAADEGPGRLVPVARYHSLGTPTVPEGLISLGSCAATNAEGGRVVMAAELDLDWARTHLPNAPEHPARAMGLQFHPESILSPSGPIMLHRVLEYLIYTSGSGA